MHAPDHWFLVDPFNTIHPSFVFTLTYFCVHNLMNDIWWQNRIQRMFENFSFTFAVWYWLCTNYAAWCLLWYLDTWLCTSSQVARYRVALSPGLTSFILHSLKVCDFFLCVVITACQPSCRKAMFSVCESACSQGWGYSCDHYSWCIGPLLYTSLVPPPTNNNLMAKTSDAFKLVHNALVNKVNFPDSICINCMGTSSIK